MTDRVHPSDSPSEPDRSAPPEGSEPNRFATSESFNHRPKPPPGTYVIHVPKDQIYRVPSPEKARLYQSYSRRNLRKRRSSSCCRCLCYSSVVLALVLVLAAVTVGILYLVYKPELPRFSIDRLATTGLNLTTNNPISPTFLAAVRAENPNEKIGVDYRSSGSVSILYDNVRFGDGDWPTFYQETENVTVFQTTVRGSGIRLSTEMQRSLGRGMVPMELDMSVPVRFKFGAVTSWTVTVKVQCDVTIDKLTAESSKIVSNACRTRVDVL